MFRDHRKPWSRTASVQARRWSSHVMEPDPAPTPDPQPPDDDDDELQIWTGSKGKHKTSSSEMYVQAIGEAGCGGTGECWSGIFAETRRYDDLYKAGAAASGSSPGRIGRQAVRTFKASGGGGQIETFMLAPHTETANGASKHPVTRHLYFAWLDDRHHNAICPDQSGWSSTPSYDEAEHEMLTFDGDPQFAVQQPWVETWGKLSADTSVDWTHVRATLFGIVGTSAWGTPLAWAWSQPAKEVASGTWEFGTSTAGALRGVDADAWDVIETFVVGWGLYKKHDVTYAAVTPPLCAKGVCYRPGLGRWKAGDRTPLSAGLYSPTGYVEMLERRAAASKYVKK